jgi:hypothetical protein
MAYQSNYGYAEKMNMHKRIPAALALIGVAACQTVASGEDIPARIVAPTEASRAELQYNVNSALRTDVLLAEDALVESSVLTIARDQPGSMQNPVPQGRIVETPIQFRLVKRGDDCILVDQRDQTRYLLEGTDCAAE